MDLFFSCQKHTESWRTAVIHSIVIIELGCINYWVIPALSAADKSRRIFQLSQHTSACHEITGTSELALVSSASSNRKAIAERFNLMLTTLTQQHVGGGEKSKLCSVKMQWNTECYHPQRAQGQVFWIQTRSSQGRSEEDRVIWFL